jgi:putative Holliday junction resolvase
MRVLAVDVGARRIGLAISDRSRTLARPLATITVTSAGEGVRRVAETIALLSAEDDGLATVVVGMPVRLDGSPTEQTARAVAFVNALREATGNAAVTITTEDERLTSREAESRLALGERDWRRRKEKLDAAAAAVFLQDYLDRL